MQDISEFECDPFDPANTSIRSMQSGLPASEKLALDFMSAKADGMKKVDTFMDERVYSKNLSLNDRIPRSKRMSFATEEVKQVEGTRVKGKADEMECRALASVVGLVETTGAFKLEEVLQHRVTEECLPIFNVNGTFRKTQKSQLQQIMDMVTVPEPDVYTSIVEMGLMWRLTMPTAEDREKQDGSKYTYGDYVQKLVLFVVNRHRNAESIICLNDSYTHEYSIKDSERLLRQGSKPVANVFLKKDKPFPSNKEFNVLLTNADNKIRLQAFIEKEFESVAQSQNRSIIYSVVGGATKNLRDHTEEPSLNCNHAEADTAMFTMYSVLRNQGYTSPVVMDTEDTDNYTQSTYVANRVPGDLYMKRKHQLVDAQQLCDQDLVDSLIPLHLITGGDHTSGFYGVGKKTVARRVKQFPEARELLAGCGADIELTESVANNLVKFVIRYVYADFQNTTPRNARASKCKSQKRKSLTRMVPDYDSLLLHLRRVNYLTYLQKHFQLKDHPSPIGYGWHIVNGMCLPIRSTLPPLPMHIPMSTESQAPSNEMEISTDTEDTDESDDDTQSCGSDDINIDNEVEMYG